MYDKTNFTATQNLVYAAFFVALGIIIPQLFHIFGDNAGRIFLPMYLPVILGALLLPLRYTLIMAAVIPILSFFLTGMPPLPLLYFIFIEIIIYALIAYLLIKRFNIYLTVAGAIIGGRLSYILSILVAANLLGMDIPFAAPTILLPLIAISIPGMIIQLIIVPVIYNRIYKVRFVPMADQVEKLIKIIDQPEYTLAALLADGNIYTDSGLGVKPIITKMRSDQDFFCDSVVADKVIGKAAALLLVLGKAKHVHGKVMSQSAIAVLKANDIPYGYGKKVPCIKNRDKTGMCPLEQAVHDIDEPHQGYQAIEAKIKELMEKSE